MACQESFVSWPLALDTRAIGHTMYIPDVYPKESTVEQGFVFKSNRSQAVRLPKTVALPPDVTRVDIVAIGRARILAPAGEI
jgi:antitoxin VapB